LFYYSFNQFVLKKIALISDSHGYIDQQVIWHLESVDEVWHAGDIGDKSVIDALPKHLTQRIITGNIDDLEAQSNHPEELFFEVEGVKVLMIHIGGKPPRYANGVLARIKSLQPQLLVCGHSHICKVEFDAKNECLYMNPGAIGQHGFHVMRTLLTFEVEKGKLKNLAVVELGKRGK
jgi:uncharacterized protein